MKKNRKQNGFTLIELLAVLMIIGVLAALGIPRYFRAVERNRLGEAPTILQSAKDGVARACLRGAMPADLTALDTDWGTLRYFANPTLVAGGNCAAYSVTMARSCAAPQDTATWAGCYAAGCVATATMDQNGAVTWTGAVAACQP